MSPPHALLGVTTPRATRPSLLPWEGWEELWAGCQGVCGSMSRDRGFWGRRDTLRVAREDAFACTVAHGPPHLMFPCLLAQGKSQAFSRHRGKAELVWGGGNGKRVEEEHRQQWSRCRFLDFSPPRTWLLSCLLLIWEFLFYRVNSQSLFLSC